MELDRPRATNLSVMSPRDRSGQVAPRRLLPECVEALRLLWDFADRTLPTLETEHVREHFMSCSRCRPHVRFEVRLLRAIAESRPRSVDMTSMVSFVRRAVAHEQHDVADG